MNASYNRLLSSVLCLSLATASSGGHAELLGTASSTERDRVMAALQRPEIRARLVDQGIDPTAAEARVAALTDEEATLLAAKFDELPVGSGGSGEGLFALLVVAAAVYVVVQFWPFFLIGGTALVAIKTSNRRST